MSNLTTALAAFRACPSFETLACLQAAVNHHCDTNTVDTQEFEQVLDAIEATVAFIILPCASEATH